MKRTFFVTGIDTDTGKSYATGWLARLWRERGESVITQKLIQTGCPEGTVSEDILTHRRLMGIAPLPEDVDFTTCPLRFKYPASPDLAARMEGRLIDLAEADRSTARLLEKYDTVLVEGAGGLLVPIKEDYTMADYAVERGLPVILVTSARLGSVNHTMLTLEAARARGLRVEMLIYNMYGATSPEITDDTFNYLSKYFNNILKLLSLPL